MQSWSVPRVPWPQPGARLPLPASSAAHRGHLCVSIGTENQGSQTLASQAERGGLARKVVWTGGRQTIARKPAPQRPPGETSEPPEERRKEATDWKDDKTGRERRTRLGGTGFHGLVEVALLEPTRANWRDLTACARWGSPGGGRRSFAAPSRQAGSGRSCAGFAVALREERAPTPAGQAPPTRRPEPLGVDPQNRVAKHPPGSANTHTEPAPRGALTHGASPPSSPALETEERAGGGTGK